MKIGRSMMKARPRTWPPVLAAPLQRYDFAPLRHSPGSPGAATSLRRFNFAPRRVCADSSSRRFPFANGMGGGSSRARRTLRALYRWGTHPEYRKEIGEERRDSAEIYIEDATLFVYLRLNSDAV